MLRGWRWGQLVAGAVACMDVAPKAAVEARRSLKQNHHQASVVGQHQLLRVRLERVGGAYLIKHELGGVFDVVVLGEQLDVLLDYCSASCGGNPLAALAALCVSNLALCAEVCQFWGSR